MGLRRTCGSERDLSDDKEVLSTTHGEQGKKDRKAGGLGREERPIWFLKKGKSQEKHFPVKRFKEAHDRKAR